MLQTEYVRNLHCNYERLLLNQKPEDKRYQYCILSRGGIKGLLPCSLRYIDGQAYLYYDISSKQNIAQIFERRCITRDWICDFMWSYRQIQQELDRFLLDDHNVIWHPEQNFPDMENLIITLKYIPYCEYENSFGKLVDFWVEHIDYEDETLVEFVYHVYDQLEKNGDIYLQGQIFEDAVLLERKEVKKTETIDNLGTEGMEQELQQPPTAEEQLVTTKEEKKKFFSIFEGKKRKNKDIQENYRKEMQREMNGYAVAEEETYTYGKTIDDDQETEYGRTVYIEERPDSDNMEHRLYSPEGKLLASLSKEIFCIGKKKEEVDLVLEDISVSRMHARIMKQGTEIYLEDLNSTNGTYKNGLRLEPYERRKLESEDEIKCGNIILIFR